MSQTDDVVGKTAMVKFSYLERPCSAKVVAFDNEGLCLEGGDIMVLIEQAASGPKKTWYSGPAGTEVHTRFPLLFLPFAQVQWLAAPKA